MDEINKKCVAEFQERLKSFEGKLFADAELSPLRTDWITLLQAYDEVVKVYEHERVGNKVLLEEIRKLGFARGLDKALLSLYQQNFTSAVADYLIHPEPVLIPCTHNNVSQTFSIGLSEVLIIKSKGRTKLLYLRKKFRPLEGGEERNVIMVNKNELDFAGLMFLLQRNGNHVLRISQSYAVNIILYGLTDANTFKLNVPQPEGFDKKLSEVKTDKYFDVALYQKRLLELDRLAHHVKDFEINLDKIDEINRYKKSMGIT